MGERTQAPSRVHGPTTVKYAEACDAVAEGGGGLAAAVEPLRQLAAEHILPEQQ